jgi:hypothetical protein
MNCCTPHFGFVLQSGDLKWFALSWSEKLFAPAFESVTPVAPVTLSNDPVAEDIDPDTCAE